MNVNLKNARIYIALLFTFAILSTSTADADVTATWSTGNGKEKIKLEYKNDKTMRLSAFKDRYTFILKGRQYMVVKDKEKWRVVDLDKMRKKMKKLGVSRFLAESEGKGDVAKEKKPTFSFADTGKKETVAGLEGTVYTITETDPETKEVKNVTSLLTANKAYRKAWYGWMSAMTSGLRDMGSTFKMKSRGLRMEASLKQLKKMGLAPIRIEDEMTLQSFSEKDIPDGWFKLPAEPTDGFENAPAPPKNGSAKKGDSKDKK